MLEITEHSTHSCTAVQQQPGITSTYFLPWASPEKAGGYQGPLQLWRSHCSWSHTMSSQTSIKSSLLALASHKQHSSSPAANGPAIFDTCLPLMHAGQGCSWILCFSPDEFVRLFSYLFSKLSLGMILSWNISSTKMLILYFITVANRIFNAFSIPETHMSKYMPQVLLFWQILHILYSIYSN